MKNLVLILLLSISFIACKKESITPGNYQTTTPQQDTTSWQNGYGNGGTLPNWGNPTNGNDLVGKKFRVVDYKIGIASQMVNADTLYFISLNQYKVGYQGTVYTYNFYATSYGNATFVLNNFVSATNLSLSATIGDNAFTNTNWPLNAVRSITFRQLPNLPPTQHIFTFERVL